MKALFTCLFVTFIACTAFAQTPDKAVRKRSGHVSGLRAGGNLSGTSQGDLHFGYHAGVFFDLHPARNYGYSLEVNFSRQGANYYNTPVVMSYVVVPVLFNLYVSELALQTGVYAAPLLHARNRDLNNTYDYTGSMNGMDLGLAFGVKRAVGRAGLGLRYYHGLENLAASGSKVVNQKLELSLQVNL